MKHQTISFVKSFFRLGGYVLLLVNLPLAAGVLFFSEVIGILEEIGHE